MVGIFQIGSALKKADVDASGFNDDIQKYPELKKLLEKANEDKSIADEKKLAMVVELGKSWKKNPDVLRQIENDLTANPQRGTEIINTAKSDPEKFKADLAKYSAGLPVQQASADNRGAKADFDLGKIDTMSDSQISAMITPDAVKEMADVISVAAVEKGADPVAAKGFAQKIKADPWLAGNIANTLKNNPSFVRELVKTMKGPPPTNSIAKQQAQAELNKLMAKPELLTNDAYVKQIEGKMQMAKNGIGGMMSQIMGPLKQGFENMTALMGGFTGMYPVISVSMTGTLLPNVMINLDNWRANQADAANAAAYSDPRNMTVYAKKGPDGLYVQKVIHEKEKGGPSVEKIVPNGAIEVKTADGKTMNVVPSMGGLEAKQTKGFIGPDGKYVEGNYRVPVIESVDPKTGEASKVTFVQMTPADFNKYKNDVMAAAEKMGMPQKYPYSSFTEADLKGAPKPQPLQVVKVDPTTGAPTATVVEADPTKAQSFPVKPQGTIEYRDLNVAANDPAYEVAVNRPQ